jgi:hypothetical protein
VSDGPEGTASRRSAIIPGWTFPKASRLVFENIAHVAVAHIQILEDSMTDYLDPTDSVAVPRKTAPRPARLEGKVITLLDISKAKAFDEVLARLTA